MRDQLVGSRAGFLGEPRPPRQRPRAAQDAARAERGLDRIDRAAARTVA
ncbi:MAG TPA: hypothetical protein VI006_13310 [Solirubrobacteraceae bacterium]